MSEKRSSWERNGIFLRHIGKCIYTRVHTHTHTQQLCLLSWEQMQVDRQFFLNVASIVCRCRVPVLRSRMQQLCLWWSHHVAVSVLWRWAWRIWKEMENSCPTVKPGFLITYGTTPDQMTGSLSLSLSLSQPVQTNTPAHTHTHTHTHIYKSRFQ